MQLVPMGTDRRHPSAEIVAASLSQRREQSTRPAPLIGQADAGPTPMSHTGGQPLVGGLHERLEVRGQRLPGLGERLTDLAELGVPHIQGVDHFRRQRPAAAGRGPGRLEEGVALLEYPVQLARWSRHGVDAATPADRRDTGAVPAGPP